MQKTKALPKTVILDSSHSTGTGETNSPASAKGMPPQTSEHFIPVEPGELALFLERTTDFLPGERDQFREFYRRLAQVVELEGNRRLHELRDEYRRFDPDSDLISLDQLPPSDTEKDHTTFFATLRRTLERANYVPLSRVDVENAVRQSTDWGFELEVDFQLFSQLEVFARGDTSQQRHERKKTFAWGNAEEKNIPAWQRLIVAFSPKPGSRLAQEADANRIYLKLFKNIPRNDLELLLPGGKLRMSLYDQGKILLPTVSGIGLVMWKLLRGSLVVALEGLSGGLALISLLGGTLGYGLKSYYGYYQTRDKHQSEITRNLYFQNLDNNAGALFRVVEEAREQELREALLAYFALWRSPLVAGRRADEVDREVESLLHQALRVKCDLEIVDALDKLTRFKLAEQLPNNRWRVHPLSEAISRLADYRKILLGDTPPVSFGLRIRRAA